MTRSLAYLLGILLLLLAGCLRLNDGVAGSGSSGVDNPEVIVAFTGASGASAHFSGTVLIYDADQNPVLDPEPLVRIRVNGDTAIRLSPLDFSRTGTWDTAAYNVLALGDDSADALFQNFVYQPAVLRKTAAIKDGDVFSLRLRLAKAVGYQGTLSLVDPRSLERVFVPGSPFKAVVVDGKFTFERIPAGIFPLHLMRGNGDEIRLRDSLNTEAPGQFDVDTSAPPIVRPRPTPPFLQVQAGVDQIVSLQAQSALSGRLQGVVAADPHVSILWRQVSPNPQTVRAVIENPTQLKTQVTLPQLGVYRFALLASYGADTHRADTVTLTAKATAFVQPEPGDTLRSGASYAVTWSDEKAHALTLQYSANGGASWTDVSASLASQAGLNSYVWTPTGLATANGMLRILENTFRIELARTGEFVLRAP